MTKDYLEVLQAMVEDVMSEFPPDVDLEFKHMFGGKGAYVRGRIFAVLWKDGLALKLSEEDQQALLELAGASLTAPIGKKYTVVPEPFLEQKALLSPWVDKSFRYALTLPLPEKKKRKKKV